MPTDREVALEQALVAIIAAAETGGGVDVGNIIKKAGLYIVDSGSPYQIASNAYGVQAVQEISNAHALVLSRTE